MEPEYYWQVTPDYDSTTTEVGGISEPAGSYVPIYGSAQDYPASYFVLNHRGYVGIALIEIRNRMNDFSLTRLLQIFAQVTGTYTFTTSNADDIVFLYLGQNAYKGYTRDNADATAVCCSYPGNTASATIALVQGQYMPFRIVFGQQGGPVIFSLSVTAPDGTVILDSNTQNSPFVVQYSCDGTSAPAFAPWAQE